jgi:hypothetical protein
MHIVEPSCLIVSNGTNKDVSTFSETSFLGQKQSLPIENPKYLVPGIKPKSL